MKTNISFKLNPCQSVRIRNWQSETETTKRPSFPGWVLLIVMMLLLVVPLAAFSKGGPPDGKGGGGGKNSDTTVVTTDYGDIFGDLIHIYRHEVTGQPIFAQRWVEMPAEIEGYGWGYCAIVYTDLVLDAAGYPTRIPFAPDSCDLDTAALADEIAALVAGDAATLAATLADDLAVALLADLAADLGTGEPTDAEIAQFVAELAAELAAYLDTTLADDLAAALAAALADNLDDVMKFAELVAGLAEELAPALAAELAPELAAELAADLIVEVDYFGRLNGSRTRENNLRMHFDEVISNINQAVRLKLGPVGRLMLEFCETWEYDPTLAKVCTSHAWSTIDSPMESLGLYTRLTRYGHLATDPDEEDLFWHGDPALYDEADPPYPTHPALTVEDFQKFADAGLGHLLPAGTCWVNGEFLCAAPEALEAEDFDSSAIYLGAAASKTGWVTVDLLQYLNRFLRISVATVDPNEDARPPSSYDPVDSLPALYEHCWSSDDDTTCIICNADGVGANHDSLCPTEGPGILCTDEDDAANLPANLPVNYYCFANIQERFMNFEESAYTRGIRPNAEAALIMPFKGILNGSLYDEEDGMTLATTLKYFDGDFSAPQAVNLLEWIDIPNPLEWIVDIVPENSDYDYGFNIANYVIGANDAARSIEFIHNYEIPADLYCKYLVDPDHPLWNLDGFDCPTVD